MSYANVSDMLAECGVSVHRSTIYRWFIEYAPILRQKLRRYQFTHTDSSWQLDETYIKVNEKWFYLYRAINKHGTTLDFYFSPKRNKNAAYQFLKRVLKPYPVERQPKILNTDKHSSYGYAITRLIKEGKLRDDAKQRQVKYLNNRIESDHAPIKKLVKAYGASNGQTVPGQRFRYLKHCDN
jgi:IS6 family transposase